MLLGHICQNVRFWNSHKLPDASSLHCWHGERGFQTLLDILPSTLFEQLPLPPSRLQREDTYTLSDPPNTESVHSYGLTLLTVTFYPQSTDLSPKEKKKRQQEIPVIWKAFCIHTVLAATNTVNPSRWVTDIKVSKHTKHWRNNVMHRAVTVDSAFSWRAFTLQAGSIVLYLRKWQLAPVSNVTAVYLI